MCSEDDNAIDQQSRSLVCENKQILGAGDLPTTINKAMNEFDQVAAVAVDHPITYERPTHIRGMIYTGEADGLDDRIQRFVSDHKIAIERDDETVLVPFVMSASCGGPQVRDGEERTTVYVSDNVVGADPIKLEDGLAYLQDKLKHPKQWSTDSTARVDQIRGYAESAD